MKIMISFPLSFSKGEREACYDVFVSKPIYTKLNNLVGVHILPNVVVVRHNYNVICVERDYILN